MTPVSRRRKHLFLPVLAATALVVVAVVGPAPAAAEPASAPAPRWEWPVAHPRPLTRPFEAPPTRYAAGHRGIDIAAVPGGTVSAPADGIVSFAGVVVDRPVVSIRHADGLVSSIEPVTAEVSAGDAVRSAQVIGVVASGGHCDLRCVHFGVRLHGEYVNPLALLATIERAVLLPLGR